jgi:hypothetical protein
VFAVAVAGCGADGHDVAPDGAQTPRGSGGAMGEAPADRNGDREPITRALTYYADAKPIIDAKCAACHFDGGIGPMPLTAYDEVEPYTALIEVDVEAGIMPPWRARGELDHFVGDRRLSGEQKAILLAWIDQGAPEGEPDEEPDPLPAIPRGLDRVDTSLRMAEPYAPVNTPDDYRCFPLEWPYTQTKYVTGLNVEPDQTFMMHHAIVYLVGPEGAAAVRSRDEADPGPGYTCFGSTGAPTAWLTSYEPGGYGQPVPGDLGFEVEPGSIMLLQVHYNTLNGEAADQSRVDFTVEDRVERVGNVSLIMNPLWIAGAMSIPRNQPDVAHAYTASAITTPYDIYWVDLHMHALGHAGRIGIVRADNPGQLEPLLEIPDWSFEWQETYLLQQPIRLDVGDRLYVECHFDNTPANQVLVNGTPLPPRDVNWGDGTTDEMCLGNVLIADAQ